MKSILVLLICLSFLVSVEAELTLFVGDEAGFFNETGAVTVTGLYPSLRPAPNFHRVGGAVFSIGPNTQRQEFGDFSPDVAGNEYAITGPENFNVDLDLDSSAFGFVIDEGSQNLVSSFSVDLLKDGNSVGSFLFDTVQTDPLFVGVSSDQAFNRVEIRELTDGDGDENFGILFATAAVPEPGTYFLLLVAGLGMMVRQSQK